jgi:hypothetical protein
MILMSYFSGHSRWSINICMENQYKSIYDDGIFAQSQCIWHENILLDFLRSNLISCGYVAVTDNNKIWMRDGKRVVVCLVDDIISCSLGHQSLIPYLFDQDTVVITDNWINCPTQYHVARLPDSFFGIYCHDPVHQDWQPKRRFNLAVNRLDSKRLWLFLELMQRSQLQDQPELVDFVNFNCWLWTGNNKNDQDAKENFRDEFGRLSHTSEHLPDTYEHTFQTWAERMPYRNHDLDHEQVHVSAWLNMVPETYSSDNVVALSEKTFRALSVPVPWMLYSGRNSVARLSSMGFDVLSDVVGHRYDSMIELHTARYGDKIVDFVFEASDTVSAMQQLDFDQLQHRCKQAADHNINLLQQYRRAWPGDFAQWWQSVVTMIA